MDKSNPLAISMSGEYSTKKAIELPYPNAAEGEPLTDEEKDELLAEIEQEGSALHLYNRFNWQMVEDGIEERLRKDAGRFKDAF